MHTIIYAYYKKNAPPQPPAPTAAQLLAAFRRLLPSRQIWRLASLRKGRFYDRLFTPLVTLWYLIFQRLAADHTLEKVVADAQAGGANARACPKNCVPPPPFLSAMPASVCRWLFSGKA